MEPAATITNTSGIRVGTSAMWFSVDGVHVDLARRPLLRRLLLELTRVRERSPDSAATVAQLIRACWPGERISSGSAHNRLYVAVATLRRLGLRDRIANASGGYMLRPDVELQWG